MLMIITPFMRFEVGRPGIAFLTEVACRTDQFSSVFISYQKRKLGVQKKARLASLALSVCAWGSTEADCGGPRFFRPMEIRVSDGSEIDMSGVGEEDIASDGSAGEDGDEEGGNQGW
jgi:hypothetical protein